MPTVAEDPEREDRIMMEAVVDCYDAEEVAMGWYYYLQDRITFPFSARVTERRSVSPLQAGEAVEAFGMADEDDCACEMFVTVAWAGRRFGVPLAQLDVVGVDAQTAEAIADWHYWVRRGYQIC